MNTTHTTPTGSATMTIADTIKALLPTRFTILLNACLWFALATGNVSQAPRGHLPQHQTDTSGWVVRR